MAQQVSTQVLPPQATVRRYSRYFKREYGPAWVLLLCALGLAVYVVVEHGFQIFFQVSANGVMLGLTYLLVALGLALMWGVMHLLNFAHGEFFMVGAFAVWFFTVLFGGEPINVGGTDVSLTWFAGLPVLMHYAMAMLLGVIVVGGMGAVLERYIFRRFGSDLLPALLVSLGIGLILTTGVILSFGLLSKSVPTIFAGAQRPFGVTITNERVALIVASLGLLGILWWVVVRTKFGRAMRAIREDETAAALQGVNIGQYRTLVMFLGSALAAIAGALYAPVFLVTPGMGVGPMSKAFSIIVLGGLGSLPGAGVAAFFLGFVESFGATFLGSAVSDMFSFLVIILVLLFKPTGLFGHATH